MESSSASEAYYVNFFLLVSLRAERSNLPLQMGDCHVALRAPRNDNEAEDYENYLYPPFWESPFSFSLESYCPPS